MIVNIGFLPEFSRNLKRFAKKYKSLVDDYMHFLVSLQNNPFQGDELGNGVRKVRMAVTSKGKGKSGGMRVITYSLNVIDDEKIDVTLLTIYDKSEISNVSDAYIKWLISQVK